MGTRGHLKSRLEPWHQATTSKTVKKKKKKKTTTTTNNNNNNKTVLKLGCWNVRTMMTDLSASLQGIKDSSKTAAINDELKRLNVDIATL